MAKARRDYKAEFEQQLLKAGLPIKTEYRFTRLRQWQFDWAIPALYIAIEYEGGMFGKKGSKRCKVCGELPKGAHFMIERIKSDAEKYNEAAALGWCVIRALPTTVDNGMALAAVKKAVMLRRAAGDTFLPVEGKRTMTKEILLAAIPSTEPASFSEFLKALGGDAPENREEYSLMFRVLEECEKEGLVEVERTKNKVDTMQLTEAGAAWVKERC